MRITDELRKWFKARRFMGYGWEEIYSIADRIDAEYQKVIRELNELVGEMDELNEISALLPVDADGEVIHLADRVGNDEPVVRIVLTNESFGPSVYIGKSPNALHEHFCNKVRHYHKPSVEDVLRETAIDWDCAADGEDKEAVLKEYAAKFRLANDEEAQ